VQVLVRGNNVEQALRVLKKKMQREGIFREVKQRKDLREAIRAQDPQGAEAVRRARKLPAKRRSARGSSRPQRRSSASRDAAG
jgi:small subunit ribosomal protein S21